MKPRFPLRQALEKILSASYSERELKTFVEHCYFLALPFIRKKIVLGKIDLSLLGLSEQDVVYDCLAELFERDREGRLLRLTHFFEASEVPLTKLSEIETLISLRRLIFAHVNKNVVRLYAEVDPHLGRILRNLKLALERMNLFGIVVAFGEPHLVPRDLDSQKHLPPYSIPALRNDFLRYATVHDNSSILLNKLYRMLLDQEAFQRSVPLISFALLVREIYAAGMTFEGEETLTVDQAIEKERLLHAISTVCVETGNAMRDRYVRRGSVSEELFAIYLRAVEDILGSGLSGEDSKRDSYFDFLQKQMNQLDRSEYRQQHRSILEYLVKKARKKAQALPEMRVFRGREGMQVKKKKD